MTRLVHADFAGDADPMPRAREVVLLHLSDAPKKLARLTDLATGFDTGPTKKAMTKEDWHLWNMSYNTISQLLQKLKREGVAVLVTKGWRVAP